MTETDTGALLTVAQVCRRIPGARGNARANPSTVTRWIVRGCPARNGTRVKLVAVRAGCRWMVAPAALDEFFRALAATDPAPTHAPAAGPRADAAGRGASALAAKELERRGA